MTGSFVLTQGAGQKLEFAINRNGGGASAVDWLSTGDNFKKVMLLASGNYEMKPTAKAIQALDVFWKNREGLYIHNSFINCVLVYAKDGGSFDVSICDHIDLPRTMYDREIITEYMGGIGEAKKNAFTLNQLRAFIEAQWSGENGKLLTNGYSNIFYVIGEDGKLSVVHVHVHFCLDTNDLRWRVEGGGLGAFNYWGVGRRLFRNKR